MGNSSTSIFSRSGIDNTGGGGGGGGGGSITSVNGDVGPVVVLDSDNIAQGAINIYYSDAIARLAVSATGPLSYNSGSGVFSIAQATGVSDGYLSSSDFNLFSSKMSNPMTTANDLIYAGIGGTPQRLGAPGVDSFLSFVSGSIVWSAGTPLSTIEDGVTPTIAFGADEILFSDGSVVRGNSKFTYNPTTNLFQVTDGTDRFLRISPTAKTFAIGDLDGAGPYIESNLSSNELQLVATILEFGGNRYTWPAVQGTAGQVLSVDSVALGVATLEWVAAGGGGGSIENGVTTTTSFNPNQVIFSDGTNTIGSDSFTYDATSEQFRVRDSNGTILVANPTSFGALDVDDATGTLSIMADPTSYSVRADIGGAGKGPLIFLDGTTGIVGIGDLDGYVTNAHLYIDYLNSLLFVGRVGASTISSDLDKHNLSLGDNDSEANKTIFEVNDQNQFIRGSIGSRDVLNLDRPHELYEIGRLSGGNATHISIDDAARDIDLNSRTITIRGVKYSFPAADGTSGQVLSTNGSGILSWATGGGGGGISSLNGLTGATQTFTTGTAGSSFNISSVGTVHTFNQPAASTSAIGSVTTAAQIFAGAKGLNSTFVVGANTSTPSTGAILEVSSTSGFFLPPRMTTAQKVAIASGFPTAGSIVFDTDLNIGQFWTGSTWNSFGLAATSPVSGAGTNRILFTDATGGGQLQSSGNFKWDNASGAMGINFSAPGGTGLVLCPPSASDHNLRLTLVNTQTGDRIQLRNVDNFTQTGRMTVGGLWQLPTGSATTPTYSFEGDANSGMYRTGADSVAIATNGVARVTFNNNGVVVTNLIGGSAAPTVAAGTGAGTGPTISVAGSTNTSGTLTLTTGTTPAASATVGTITWSGTLGAAPRMVLTPRNVNAAALNGVSSVFISATTTTTATLTVGSTNLAASTQYIWDWVAIQ